MATRRSTSSARTGLDQPGEVGIVTLDVAVYLAIGGGPAGSASMLIHLEGLVGTLTAQHLRL